MRTVLFFVDFRILHLHDKDSRYHFAIQMYNIYTYTIIDLTSPKRIFQYKFMSFVFFN